MSNPFLALALGGLQGAKANREETIAAEDRKRKRAREDLEEKVFLAQLAQNPDIDISSVAPYVAAATGAAAGLPPGAEAPVAPPPVRRGPTSIADAGALDLPPPGLHITPRVPPDIDLDEGGGGGLGAFAGAAPPAKAPPTPGAPSTPFLDQALDLGGIDVGGQHYNLKVKNREGGKKARNRAAYEALHDADPEAYPHFIEDADYPGEMADYAKGVRQGRIETQREKQRGRRADTARGARGRGHLAEDIAYDALEQGHTLEEVMARVARDPQARGGLSPQRARSIERDAKRAAPDLEQARKRVAARLGPPTRAIGKAAAVSDDVRDAVIDALAHGHSGEEVIGAIKDPLVAATVRRWLVKKGEATRQPVP